MKGNALSPVFRPLIVVTVVVSVLIPAYAIFSFKWYYAGIESFAGNLSSGLDADDREVWYANYDPASPDAQRINVYDISSGTFTKSFSGGPEGIPFSSFRFIHLAGDEVLIGGTKGAAVYDRNDDTWTLIADGLPAIDVYSGNIREGKYWIGTESGIGIRDSEGNWEYITTDDGLPNSKVLCIQFDGSMAWVCTEGGVMKMDTSTGDVKVFTNADGLPGNVARNVLIDGNNIWLAMKGGIGKIDKTTDAVTAFTMDNGLISNEYKDIEVLGDNIYFASNKGVSYTKKDKDSNWKKITTKQGLPKTAARSGLGSDATHLAVEGDKLWIALWYEGIVQMSIPTGLAIIPVWVYIIALSAAGIIALIIIRPGSGRGEVEEKEKRIQERRKKAQTSKPPHELCGGVPQRQLCNRCKFNTLKAGKLFCNKYSIPIEYKK